MKKNQNATFFVVAILAVVMLSSCGAKRTQTVVPPPAPAAVAQTQVQTQAPAIVAAPEVSPATTPAPTTPQVVETVPQLQRREEPAAPVQTQVPVQTQPAQATVSAPSSDSAIFQSGVIQGSDKVEQKGDVTVRTQTRYADFTILHRRNGESTLPESVMWLGIQEAVRGQNREQFVQEYRLAQTRVQQEAVLRKFNPEVAKYKAEPLEFDYGTLSCPSDINTPPKGFPNRPKAKGNDHDPTGYKIITRFGTNELTRMGDPVTSLETFLEQLPKAETAIIERLPSFMNFRDRAELAHILRQVAETRKIDGVIVKEDWTHNYPFRRWSTGHGRPIEWVWFRPDERGMKERGLRIVLPTSGEVYFVNYTCGLNIDKIFGCDMKLRALWNVTTTENYLLCKLIEVEGKRLNAQGQIELLPNEQVFAHVTAQPTGPVVKEPVVDWLWTMNGQTVSGRGVSRVAVNGSAIPEGGSTLCVESRTATGAPARCCQQFVRGQVPLECTSSSITPRQVSSPKEVVTLTATANRPVGRDFTPIAHQDGVEIARGASNEMFVSFRAENVPNINKPVSIRIVDAKTGEFLFECPGSLETTLEVLPPPITKREPPTELKKKGPKWPYYLLALGGAAAAAALLLGGGEEGCPTGKCGGPGPRPGPGAPVVTAPGARPTAVGGGFRLSWGKQ